MSLINLAREYAIGMVGTGMLAAVVDYGLYVIGAITRKITLRGCFVMGLFWPLFLIMLCVLIWRHRK
ncbi:hypothetical protein D0Q53_20825 [Salmonella enterica]|nr:hypothetical protein [Salmonella enterica]EFF4796174.1 hypothetical protein [Escherichia coli]EBJ6658731.1 hypothetical protein [Salmonella enterica]EBL0923975.1 hypothetical protein [Salmonella enterica]ECO7324766.1 hypothetical protein [Salmonella enterica]